MALDTIASQTNTKLSTLVYTTILLDEDSAAIASSRIATATITLADSERDGLGSTINSRAAQDCLNANQVTIHATSGLLTWTSLPADHTIINSFIAPGELEKHTATIDITYDTTKRKAWVRDIYVTSLLKAT